MQLSSFSKLAGRCILFFIPILVTFLMSGEELIQIELDFGQFRYNRELNYLEIYYSFDESQLSYNYQNGQFEGGIYFHATVTPANNDQPVIDQVWRIPHSVVDTSFNVNNTSVSIIGVIGLGIPIMKQRLSIEILDQNNSSRGYKTSFEIPKKSFTVNRVTISDLELCSSINRNAQNPESVFYKNTLEVIPNPGNLYGVMKPRLSYYVEVYNLNQIGEIYKTRGVIVDSDNHEILSQERSKQVKSESSVEIGSFDVGSLKGGTYHLLFTISSTDGSNLVTVEKKFYIHKPEQEMQQISLSDIDLAYGNMNESDLDIEFEMVRYIALDSEKLAYNGISTVEEKRKFLYLFWKKRDPTPNTLENEFREEYMSRVNMAKIRYTVGSKAGWKTDRGRVFILYGSPDEIERFTSGMQTKPYEIWHYHQLQGGIIFVFADLFGFNDYIQLHSTHRNELHNENWMDQVEEGLKPSNP